MFDNLCVYFNNMTHTFTIKEILLEESFLPDEYIENIS